MFNYFIIENKNLGVTLYMDEPINSQDGKLRIYDKFLNYTGEYWELSALIDKADDYGFGNNVEEFIKQKIISKYECAQTMYELINLLFIDYVKVETNYNSDPLNELTNYKDELSYIILGNDKYYLSED